MTSSIILTWEGMEITPLGSPALILYEFYERCLFQ